MAGQTPELEPGTVLSDSYEIIGKIAEGGMGALYEARHVRLGDHKVAVKLLLRDDHPAMVKMAERFRREAEICSKLAHPNIIAVTDWDELPEGFPFFVMEYLEGESLAERMHGAPMAPALIYDILSQIGAALGDLQGPHHQDDRCVHGPGHRHAALHVAGGLRGG